MEEQYRAYAPKLPRELLEAFAQPFTPQEVQLRSGRQEQDQQSGQWVCRAIPFVGRRTYEARLDALVPGSWATTAPSVVVASHRLVVAIQLQIGPISHTDYGELLLPPPAEPNDLGAWIRGVPEASEQAFLGACRRFGLGRYLAELTREWVPYDRERRAIALSAHEQYAHVLKLYHQAGLSIPSTPEHPRASETAFAERKDPDTSLRARDLEWVRKRCAGQPLRTLLRHYGLTRLEDLTDVQLIEVIKIIRRHQAKAS